MRSGEVLENKQAHISKPRVFRAETVFHLVQAIVLATRFDRGRNIFSLDTTLQSTVDVDALATIGEVRFDTRPKSKVSRLLTIMFGSTLYPFLRQGHDFFGPILNRPINLLLSQGRSQSIVLLNDGRFSDDVSIRGRRNQIYYPTNLRRLFSYFIHAKHPSVSGLVFTEKSAQPRPPLASHQAEIFIDVEETLIASGTKAQATIKAVFGAQISLDITRFSTLVVLPFFEILAQEERRKIVRFAQMHKLALERTLFKIHPRTSVPSDLSLPTGEGLWIETGTYPVELLLTTGHTFQQAWFIDTSANLRNVAIVTRSVNTL